MLRCGLLGKALGHSYSPAIHRQLGRYSYTLFEKREDEVAAFLQGDEFDGLNVTIPYKKTVLPFCAALSPAAQAIGSVNTIVRRTDGSLYGDNTDWEGFRDLLETSGIPVCGKKVLVLGSGGASLAVQYALRRQDAGQVIVVSRTGADNYENLDRHRDAALIVNTTPVGMYPRNGAAPLSLSHFSCCEGVLDLIYNPARTSLMLEAEARDLPAWGGLLMLVSQARRSAEAFMGTAIPDERITEITRSLSRDMENIVLIGMPGSGKTAVGTALANRLGRPFADADAALVQRAGMPIPAFFAKHGEEAFRNLEAEVLQELGKASGTVLATGGGCVLREENYFSLHQNGRIFFLQRELASLPRDGRPLSEGADLQAMYTARLPRYRRFADQIIENRGTVTDTVRAIEETLR